MHARHLRVGLHGILVVLTLAVLSMSDNRLSVAMGEGDLNLTPPPVPIKEDLFGLNVINLEYGVTWPTVPFASWRSFNSYWTRAEPDRGRWNFTRLDNDIRLARQKGVDVMLVLGSTPTWASARPQEKGCCTENAPKGNTAEAQDIRDWQNYVRTVATRYKGLVRVYELWNEPNVKRFYSGSIANLVELNKVAYQAVKDIDPSATVVSSALSPCCEAASFLENFFSSGGGQYADVIGYHFYVAPKDPEAMIDRAKKVHALMKKYGISKPLWNTETGWRVLNHDKNDASNEAWAGEPLSDSLAAAYVARSYILSWAVGVERLYWYAWGHQSMGMTEYNGKAPKLVATAYREVQNWMVGSSIKSCSNQQEVWICELQRAGGNSTWILWTPNGQVEYAIPRAWGVSNWRDLMGGAFSLQSREVVTIGPLPIFLQ